MSNENAELETAYREAAEIISDESPWTMWDYEHMHRVVARAYSKGKLDGYVQAASDSGIIPKVEA